MPAIAAQFPTFTHPGYRWSTRQAPDGDLLISIQHNSVKPFWIDGLTAQIIGSGSVPDDRADELWP